MSLDSAIPPGSTIGVLGGGQLGRMIALAAANLGYKCHIYCPDPLSPAKQVTSFSTTASYDDKTSLERFARSVDVITFEFENVPFFAAETLAQIKPVLPRPAILAVAQDRLREKDFLGSIGVPTTEYRETRDLESLARAVRDLGFPAILKSTQYGYDGKGQVKLVMGTDLAAAWTNMGAPVGILERFVDFTVELSVIVARGKDGRRVSYPPVENHHRNHILDTTIVPARLEPELLMRAEAVAHHIAEQLDLVGLLAVEMFLLSDHRLLVNELAPRPHNSGHWTLDACMTSQFEQLVRAICGLPLGSVERHSDAVMKNLIGEDMGLWREALGDPHAKLHLYGKSAVRDGRKMGHITHIVSRNRNSG